MSQRRFNIPETIGAILTDQQDARTQVGVRRSEQEAAARLQQRARHLDVVMGEIREQHLGGGKHVGEKIHFTLQHIVNSHKTADVCVFVQKAATLKENKQKHG